ncbi:Rbe1 cell wall protein, partial [Operophtera brumata]
MLNSKQLTELKHTSASPGLSRRSSQLQLAPNQSQLSTFQQLTELKHTSASPGLSRRSSQLLLALNQSQLSTFQTGHRIMAFENSVYARKASLNTSSSDLYRDVNSGGIYGESRGASSPHGSSPSTPIYGDTSFSSFGPRVSNESSHYGQ